MAHEDYESADQELNALRERLPVIIEADVPTKSGPVPYSIDVAHRIIDQYAQGVSLAKIARQGEMPAYSTLLKWSKSHPEFSKLLKSVREARALHFEDAAIDAAEAARGKDADRLKVDTYIWAAEVNDPAAYGKKVSHSGDASQPIVLQVVTGFGPPNAWQTPPKLNADGTIDKASSALPVTSESVGVDDHGTDGRGSEENNGGSPAAGGGDAPARSADAAGGDSSRDVDGAEPLPAVEGHEAPTGSQEGA